MRSFLLSGVFTSYDREVGSCHPLTLDLQSSSNVKFHNNQKGKGKISAQPHTTLCIQLLNRENNDKNNTFPLGKQICFTIVWGCAETLPR